MDEIVVCMDGSSFAEEIVPYARGIAAATGARLVFLRVTGRRDELAGAGDYMRGFGKIPGVDWKVLLDDGDVGKTIVAELDRHPEALAAITTHGRTGLLQALAGSVALSVIRGARRPVLLYRPRGESIRGEERAVKIETVVATLDGSEFSQSILPHAVEMARSLKARVELVQALPLGAPETYLSEARTGDLLESSYVHLQAERTRRAYGLEVDWEVLHGDPAEAICSYVQGRAGVMLAMTSHAKGGLERAVFGSVSGQCVRRAGVPILLYWPSP